MKNLFKLQLWSSSAVFLFQENGLTLTLRLLVYPRLSQLSQLSQQQQQLHQQQQQQQQQHLLYLQLRQDQLEGSLRTSLDQQENFQTFFIPKTTF